MSPPTALLVNRYRAFAGEARLPLRPLTLLYGRNSSGKSALARALAIIGASVSRQAPSALAPGPELIRKGNFSDLAWQGDAGDYSFDLGLCWDDRSVREARFTLDGGAGRPSYIKELQIRDEGNQLIWAGIAPPGRPMRPQTGFAGADVSFVGLVPQDSEVPALRELAERLVAMRGRVRWLDSVRARPERNVQRTGSPPKRLSSDGSNAVNFLVEMPDLLKDIKSFYSDIKPSRELDVREELDLGYRIRLNPRSQSTFRIDLIDNGEGMVQVLPVLVAAALASRIGNTAILAIEEPESHLHPDAQSILAKYLCSIASADNAPTLVLETHSRVFLLGVQLAIAETRISPKNVSLAWIEQDETGRSTIIPVEFDPSGHPQAGWPIAALAEDLRLARELAKLDLVHRS